MEPSKTYNNVHQQALRMKTDIVEFLREKLAGYGNLVDQLRVMGYLGQAMVDMSNSELTQIKLADEAEKKAEIKVYQ